MSEAMNRRTFIRNTSLALGSGAIALARSNAAGAESTRPAAASRPGSKLSAYQYESQIWVRIDGAVFTCYRAGPTQKYPYFFPVVGSGRPLRPSQTRRTILGTGLPSLPSGRKTSSRVLSWIIACASKEPLPFRKGGRRMQGICGV